jgi:hypothetical protein
MIESPQPKAATGEPATPEEFRVSARDGAIRTMTAAIELLRKAGWPPNTTDTTAAILYNQAASVFLAIVLGYREGEPIPNSEIGKRIM